MFVSGRTVLIAAEHPVYGGLYTCNILEVKENALLVETPSINGKMIPLPVGTFVRLCPENHGEHWFPAEIIDRSFGSQRTLTITLPGTISRRGRETSAKGSRVIAISSGKGGVGKTALAVNLSLALHRLQLPVILIDVDLGTANVHTLLNLASTHTIADFLTHGTALEQVIASGPEGMHVISGGSSLTDLADLDDWKYSRLISAFNELEKAVNLLILDTGPGVARNVTNFLLAADEIVLVTTPDPHAVLDAYALVKSLCCHERAYKIKLVVNRVSKPGEEKQVKTNLLGACRSFLRQPVEFLGWVPECRYFSLSIKERIPLMIKYPFSPAAAAIAGMAGKLAGLREETTYTPGNLRRFWQDLRKLTAGGSR